MFEVAMRKKDGVDLQWNYSMPAYSSTPKPSHNYGLSDSFWSISLPQHVSSSRHNKSSHHACSPHREKLPHHASSSRRIKSPYHVTSPPRCTSPQASKKVQAKSFSVALLLGVKKEVVPEIILLLTW